MGYTQTYLIVDIYVRSGYNLNMVFKQIENYILIIRLVKCTNNTKGEFYEKTKKICQIAPCNSGAVL